MVDASDHTPYAFIVRDFHGLIDLPQPQGFHCLSLSGCAAAGALDQRYAQPGCLFLLRHKLYLPVPERDDFFDVHTTNGSFLMRVF